MHLFKKETNIIKNEHKEVNMKKKKLICLVLCLCMCFVMLTGCGNKKEKIIIYSSAEDYKIEYMTKRLQEEFPEYDITIEYISSGNHAARLLSEGTSTDCDITHDLEYGYMEQLDQEGLFADLSSYDTSIYVEDTIKSTNYLVEIRLGGGIIVNTEVLAEKGLEMPTCYEDLLKPEYKGLISMPNPKSSGTGYIFLKSLVNAWGEDAAFEYFDKLTPNILQYTSSGSGPVNALIQGEVAIGLGMTSQAVVEINNGAPLEVIFFEEGSPYTMYGQSIISGKEDRESVQEVFDFMVNTLNYECAELYFPEKIYKDIDFEMDNFPTNIPYSDMSNNTIEEKERLLERWQY